MKKRFAKLAVIVAVMMLAAACGSKNDGVAETVRAIAEQENATCPVTYPDGRVLESVEATDDRTITYYIECDERYTADEFKQTEKMMKGEMINAIAADDANKLQRSQVDVKYCYVYRQGGKVLHTLTIEPADWLKY